MGFLYWNSAAMQGRGMGEMKDAGGRGLKWVNSFSGFCCTGGLAQETEKVGNEVEDKTDMQREQHVEGEKVASNVGFH